MSEAIKESVIGTLDGITEKPSGWTEISVRVDGWQYPVKMATKLSPLIELARAAGSEEMEWTFKKQESDQLNPHSGKPYVNRYFEGVGPVENHADANASPTPPAKGYAQEAAAAVVRSDGMSKEEWARKDSAIHKMACIKTAADALKHTIPTAPFGLTGTAEDRVAALNSFSVDVLDLANRWHRSVLAERDDPTGERIPF